MKAFEFFGLWQRFFGKRAWVYILFWLRIAVKWFPHGEQVFCWRQMSLNMYWQSVSVSGTASTQPSYYHLDSQHKSSKTCTNKGPEKLENFPRRERENHSPNSSRVRTNNRFSRPLYILGTPLVLISGLETVPCRQTLLWHCVYTLNWPFGTWVSWKWGQSPHQFPAEQRPLQKSSGGEGEFVSRDIKNAPWY